MLRSGETIRRQSRRPDHHTTGELRDVFPVASVVFIGKSLTARGGQNPVEALAAGKPVIFGRNMQNFASLCDQLVRSRAAISVADEGELETAIRDCLQNPQRPPPSPGVEPNAWPSIAGPRSEPSRSSRRCEPDSGFRGVQARVDVPGIATCTAMATPSCPPA